MKQLPHVIQLMRSAQLHSSRSPSHSLQCTFSIRQHSSSPARLLNVHIVVIMNISALRKLLSSPASGTHVPFSALSPTSGSRRERITLFARAAAFLSSGSSDAAAAIDEQNTASLLRGYLTQSHHAVVLSSLRDLFVSPVIDSIAAAVRRAAARDKQQLTSLVVPHYHRKTLQAMGFPISSNAFSTARRHARAVGAGAPPSPPPLPPSKQPPTPAVLNSLASFLNTHFQSAACRTVKVEDEYVLARILSHTHAELHRQWKKRKNGSLLSLSAFIAAVRSLRVYKPVSKRATDMCDHCMEGERHLATLDQQLAQHRSTCAFTCQVRIQLLLMQSTSSVPPSLSAVQAAVASSSCHCNLLPSDITATTSLVPVVCFYLHHRSIKQQLWSEYQRQQTSLQPGEVIITLDFKENVRVNIAPDEASRLFYNQSQRTVLISRPIHATPSSSLHRFHLAGSHSRRNVCAGLPEPPGATARPTTWPAHEHISGVIAAVTSVAASLLLA